MANKKTNGKDPAVLLYTQDFIVGTLTMTNEQRGKYIMLLCLQRQKGRLSEIDLKQFLNEEDIVVYEKFNQSSDGFYYNERMAMEIENRKISSNRSRTNGSKSQGRPPKVSIQLDTIEETQNKPTGNLQVISRLSKSKPTNNLAGDEAGAANENGNVIGNKAVSKSTRRIIKKALDTLIEYELSQEQYTEAAYNVNEIGGLNKAYEILGIRTGDDWSRQILQNSLMYGFNIKE